MSKKDKYSERGGHQQMKRSAMQSGEPACYLRPRTRGELVGELRAGTPCEVVADNESTTRMLIDGWLSPPPYTTRLSENAGWVVFERDNKNLSRSD